MTGPRDGHTPTSTARYACICRCFTTFDPDGRVDPDAFRRYLQRFVDVGFEPWVASSGTGVGQSLTPDDLELVYRSAVETCQGDVPVGANVPEQFSSAFMLDQVQLAISCGVDIVNIYGPDGRHSYEPTEREYLKFFDRILGAISHPVGLCPLPALGYRPLAQSIATLCNNYDHVTTVTLTGIFDDAYFLELLEHLDREVRIFVVEPGSANLLKAGAAGLSGNGMGVIPRTYRRYLDLIAADRLAEAANPYREIRRLQQLFDSKRWGAGSPRLHQMFLDAYSQPGSGGRLPDPYLNATPAEYDEFVAELRGLRLPELEL